MTVQAFIPRFSHLGSTLTVEVQWFLYLTVQPTLFRSVFYFKTTNSPTQPERHIEIHWYVHVISGLLCEYLMTTQQCCGIQAGEVTDMCSNQWQTSIHRQNRADGWLLAHKDIFQVSLLLYGRTDCYSWMHVA